MAYLILALTAGALALGQRANEFLRRLQVVSPSSWTPDEDFALLIEAAPLCR